MNSNVDNPRRIHEESRLYACLPLAEKIQSGSPKIVGLIASGKEKRKMLEEFLAYMKEQGWNIELNEKREIRELNNKKFTEKKYGLYK